MDTGCDTLECTGYFDDNSDWQDNVEMVAKKYFKAVKICRKGDSTCLNYKVLKMNGVVAGDFVGGASFAFVLPDGAVVKILPIAVLGIEKILYMDSDVNGV